MLYSRLLNDSMDMLPELFQLFLELPPKLAPELLLLFLSELLPKLKGTPTPEKLEDLRRSLILRGWLVSDARMD